MLVLHIVWNSKIFLFMCHACIQPNSANELVLILRMLWKNMLCVIVLAIFLAMQHFLERRLKPLHAFWTEFGEFIKPTSQNVLTISWLQARSSSSMSLRMQSSSESMLSRRNLLQGKASSFHTQKTETDPDWSLF
jgi:hypothetical protein